MNESTKTPRPTPPDTTGMWFGSDTLSEKDRMRWLDALDAFEVSQRAKGTQASTLRRRVTHMRRFALDVNLSPWHVTGEDLQGWLEQLDVADSTRLSMRDSLRAFYRWGKASGRSRSDASEAISYRTMRLPVPEAWSEPLVAYERHLWARGVMPNSVRSMLESLRTFARDNASADPFEMTLDDLYEWMAGKRWSRETRRGRKATVRDFYRWAVETGRMKENPADRLPTVKASDPVARPATDEEYAAAIGAADERWTLALRLSAELGLRRAEVASVHSSDVVRGAEGGSWLSVRGKGSKVRRVPLPESLALTLRTLPPGYVFPGQVHDEHAHAAREGHISPRYLGKRLAELLPPGVTMHALRHRFATRAYNVNRDVFTVQKLLGHASASTTQRYVQVSDERMRALVEAVNS